MPVVLKSSEELERMRIAGRLASEVLDFIRVIRDGAPNRVISRAEYAPTRWNTAALVSRPNPIAVRAL